MPEQLETVVIGGGAMGLSTAWNLSRRGRPVSLVERFTVGNRFGASHGATRNFNQSYSDPGYLGMLVEAERLWRELESESSTPLLDLVGIANHGDPSANDAAHEAMAAAGIRSEFLEAEEAAERWPGMRFDGRVLFAPDSGRLRAAEALAALHDRALAAGADLRFGTRVLGLEVMHDHRVRVITAAQDLIARHVIVTAGAWTTGLLSGVMPLPALRVTQEQPAHFAVRTDALSWPGFNHNPIATNSDHQWWPSAVYGMFTPGEGVKVGWHGSGQETDPDARSFESEPTQLAALQRYVSEWLPGADPEQFAEVSCTYTTTPDSNFFLESIGPVTVGAGFSGHGFKFTPVIGRILADLADGTDTRPTLASVPF
jgi:sarcosine oxidase